MTFYVRFRTAYENGQKNGIVKFARERFFCKTDTTNIFDEDSPFLAAIDMRVQLSSKTHKQLIPSELSKQITSHGRIVDVFPDHRQYFYSGFSAEPLLAEASAQGLDVPNNFVRLTKKLDWLLEKFDGEKGDRGELVSRILLTLAHDRAILELEKTSPSIDNQIRFTRPLKVIDFLKALIHEDHHDRVLDSHPQIHQKNSKPLKEEFANAFINFTYFMKASDSTVASTSFIWKALSLSGAIQCIHEQREIDTIIPLIFARDGVDQTKITEETVSAILIQVKNRISGKDVNINTKTLNFFKTQGIRSCIGIVMELGERKGTLQIVKVPERTTEMQTRGSDGEKNPMYFIEINGTHGAYGGINDEESDALNSLLSKGSADGEYQHEGEKFRDARRRLMVTVGEDSFEH